MGWAAEHARYFSGGAGAGGADIRSSFIALQLDPALYLHRLHSNKFFILGLSSVGARSERGKAASPKAACFFKQRHFKLLVRRDEF